MNNEKEYLCIEACRYVSNLKWSKKIHSVDSSAYYVSNNSVVCLMDFDSFHSHTRINKDDGIVFLEYAYLKSDVEACSKKEKTKTRKPISWKEVIAIEERYCGKKKVIQIEQAEIIEEDMAKVIVETNATVEKLEPSKFLSVDESKAYFKSNNGKARSKYAWYENKITFERFVALEFYKNIDYEQKDIDWLSTKYTYLYYAFEKNGTPLLIQEPVKATKKNGTGEKKIAQSSAKINTGNTVTIFEDANKYLSLPVSKRLWILQRVGAEGWSWFIKGAGAKANIFLAPNGKEGESKFLCKAYLKEDYSGLHEMSLGIEDEIQIKHIVNGYIYERRDK